MSIASVTKFDYYRYVQYTWGLQLSTSHIAKSVWDCEADLHVI